MHSHPNKYWLDYTNLMESDQARLPKETRQLYEQTLFAQSLQTPRFSERSRSAIFWAIIGALPPARLLPAIALEYMKILGGLAIFLQKQAINCIGNKSCLGDPILGIQGTLGIFYTFLPNKSARSTRHTGHWPSQ